MFAALQRDLDLIFLYENETDKNTPVTQSKVATASSAVACFLPSFIFILVRTKYKKLHYMEGRECFNDYHLKDQLHFHSFKVVGHCIPMQIQRRSFVISYPSFFFSIHGQAVRLTMFPREREYLRLILPF